MGVQGSLPALPCVLIVMNPVGTLTANAKSRTSLFIPALPTATHNPHITPSVIPFV